MRRWLREERVRDALLVKIFASVCDCCGRWLWREDGNGWTHGSAMHLADGRMIHAGAIAAALSLTRTYVHALLDKIWGSIHFRAAARFPLWRRRHR